MRPWRWSNAAERPSKAASCRWPGCITSRLPGDRPVLCATNCSAMPVRSPTLRRPRRSLATPRPSSKSCLAADRGTCGSTHLRCVPSVTEGGVRCAYCLWTTARTSPTCSRACWNTPGIKSAARMPAKKPCRPPPNSFPRPFAWTSACRTWTDTNWPSGCANNRNLPARFVALTGSPAEPAKLAQAGIEAPHAQAGRGRRRPRGFAGAQKLRLKCPACRAKRWAAGNPAVQADSTACRSADGADCPSLLRLHLAE